MLPLRSTISFKAGRSGKTPRISGKDPGGAEFVLETGAGVFASMALSGLALILIGAGTSLYTGRNMAYSAARQVLFGFAAAAVTYGVGALVGAAIVG